MSRRVGITFIGDCEFCHKPIRGTRYASKITGWVEHRAAGGANHVVLSSRPLAYAHHACLGIAKAQPAGAVQGNLL